MLIWELENVSGCKDGARFEAERSNAPLRQSAVTACSRYRYLSTLAALLVAVVWFVGAPVVSPALKAQAVPDLDTRLRQLIGQPKWESGLWGLHIVSLRDGKVLFSSNSHKLFLPASNMKLLIGAAALDTLGPDFRFETPVYADGVIDAHGRLFGNLIIVGRGDPNLEGRVYDAEHEELMPRDIPNAMAQIADQVVDRRVQSIVGDILADETLFLHEPLDPSWALENLLWGYGAPVSSLAVTENSFQLEILPGEAIGSTAFIRPIPIETGMVYVNQIKTVREGAEAWIGIDRNYEESHLTLTGEIPLRHAGLKYNLAVRDAGVFATQLLKLALAQRGVAVTGKARARRLPVFDILESGKISLDVAKKLQSLYRDENRLAIIRTQPISESLKIMMKVSNNLYAEMMLRNLGARSTGLGSVETGVAALEEFLKKTGTPRNAVSLNDGSGLSRKNLITPDSVVRVLQYMDQHPHRAIFLDMLPVAGRDGTLKKRMKRSPAFERIFAKTGSIEFVNTLSGYAVSRNGDRLAFSIMVNNTLVKPREVRETIDMICDWMTR